MSGSNIAELFQMNLCRSADKGPWLEKTKILKCGLKMLENSWINQWMLIKQNLGDCLWSASYVSGAGNLLGDKKERRKAAVPSARTIWEWASFSEICPELDGGLRLFHKLLKKQPLANTFFHGTKYAWFWRKEGNLNDKRGVLSFCASWRMRNKK